MFGRFCEQAECDKNSLFGVPESVITEIICPNSKYIQLCGNSRQCKTGTVGWGGWLFFFLENNTTLLAQPFGLVGVGQQGQGRVWQNFVSIPNRDSSNYISKMTILGITYCVSIHSFKQDTYTGPSGLESFSKQ